MRQLILYSAVSLDNFIAGPNDDIEWLHSPDFVLPGEDYGYSTLYDSIDTTLMGNNTYRVVIGFDKPFPYPDKTNYVFSRSSTNRDTEYVRFINGDIAGFVRELKSASGKDIWLVGGEQINSLLLNYNLIDKVILTRLPVTIGEGIPLFDRSLKNLEFNLENSERYSNGIEQITLIQRKN